MYFFLLFEGKWPLEICMDRGECNVKTDDKEMWCEVVEKTYVAFCCEYGSEPKFSRKAEQFWAVCQFLKVCLM